MRHASDDCDHPEFEGRAPLPYMRKLWRCKSCGTVYNEATEPVQRWMAATGRGVDPEPFA